MDVQLARNGCFNLNEELLELYRSMSRVALSEDFAGCGVERSKQVSRSMANVVVGLSFGLAQTHRQDRLSTLERLNLRFLVNAQHDRVVRRVHIQANNVAYLFDELRVLRETKRFRAMGLKSERSPNTADRRMTQPKMLGHRPRTPMGSSLGSRLQRLGHDFLDLVVRDRALYPGPGFVVQTFQSLFYKATSPLAHRAQSELFGHEEGAFTGATRARRGYFELAHHGTIFLDEIGEMPLHLQVKLLRALEDRSIRRVGSESPVEINVRIVAATNRNLKQEMEAKLFRPDLYYRLAVVTLTVPPLRERLEDIPDLAHAFLERSRRGLGRHVTGFLPEAMEALWRHKWPGNVRELINVIERAVLLAPAKQIRLADLRGGDGWTLATDSAIAGVVDDAVPEPRTREATEPQWESFLGKPYSAARKELLKAFERDYLLRSLVETGGRIGQTAKRAGINERTLYAMMKRHGLRKEDFREARPTGSR